MNKVTIIVPTYKGSAVISRCLDSIIKQTYSDIEIIVVDDNGKGTEEQVATSIQVDKYQKYNDYVKYIVHELNSNGSVARNTGMKYATGKYVCFFDDDDCYQERAIETMATALDKSNNTVALAYCSCTTIVTSGREKQRLVNQEGNILFNYLMDETFLCSSNVMFKKNVISEVGGWDESFKRHQDVEIITRVLSRYKACCVKYIGVVKFQEERNIPRKASILEEQGIYFLTKMKPYLEMLGYEKAEKIYSHYKINWAKWYCYELNLKKFFSLAIASKRPIKCVILSARFVIVRWLRI